MIWVDDLFGTLPKMDPTIDAAIIVVQAGLTPLEAIAVATRNGARLLGIDGEAGTLEPGKKANFIVLEKDPSSEIRNTGTIHSVWTLGRKVSDGPLPTGGRDGIAPGR